MLVALRSFRFIQNRRYAWWNDDCCFRVTLGNNVVDDLAIAGPVCCHRRNVNIDLIKEAWHHRDVADIIRRQFHRNDLMRVSIDTEMQLAPSAPGPDAVFLIEPFTLAVDFQTTAVDSRCSGSLRSIRFGKIGRPPPRRLSVV
jgi:hypothetical protein